jgi:hypothetical protein
MKNITPKFQVIVPILGSFILLITSCGNKFEFIENRNGQSVFLDGARGKVIYVDETNRIIDYLDLNPGETTILDIEMDKRKAAETNERGTIDIPGQDYSVSLSTRFYNNNLLYIINVTPYDSKVSRFADTLRLKFYDRNGFLLGYTDRINDWNTTVDDNGKQIGVQAAGNFPMTLRNYLEIYNWSSPYSSSY